VLRGEGLHIKTLASHNTNVKRYLIFPLVEEGVFLVEEGIYN